MSAMMMGALESQREVMMNLTLSRTLDSIPNSLLEKSPTKMTEAAEWHLVNLQRPQVNSIKKKIECFQSYIDTQLQVPTATGHNGTNTLSGLVSST